MKIIVLSSHPDDAETGTGGLCARAAKEGHRVLIVHLSSEVRGKKIKGRPESEVRVAEGRKSAGILGVKVEFLDYLMGEFPVTLESSRKVDSLLLKNKPDIVFTQWPVDSHPDHQAAGILPLRSYIWHKKFCLVFYEVYTGIQTIGFHPNRYVDISDFIDRKRKCVLAHRSQKPEIQVKMHDKISAFRGLEMGCEHAEAYCVLGGEGKTAFDGLFHDIRLYHQSGGMEQMALGKW